MTSTERGRSGTAVEVDNYLKQAAIFARHADAQTAATLIEHARDLLADGDSEQEVVPQSGSIADSRANGRAAGRLLQAQGSIYEAFDHLGCGFDHDQVIEFLNGTLAFQTLPDDARWKVAGMVMGFAMVAVESERIIRDLGRRHV